MSDARVNELRYWRVNHGPNTAYVKAYSPEDAAAAIVEADMDNEDDPSEWLIQPVSGAITMNVDDDGDQRQGTLNALFAASPRGVLASTEY